MSLKGRTPGLLADPGVMAARAAARGEPHVAPLTRYVAGLRDRYGAVPDFDPADGGIEARLLVLLEAPGPGSSPLRFVSRDNPTGTAANLRRFLGDAGIARRDTVIWNAVPWIIHAPGARNRAPLRGEIAAGLAELPDCLALLPRLAVVILSGRTAARAAGIVTASRPGLPILEVPHPSPTIVCTSPDIGARIARGFAAAAEILDGATIPL